MSILTILSFLQNSREDQISFLMTPNLWKLDSDFWGYKKKMVSISYYFLYIWQDIFAQYLQISLTDIIRYFLLWCVTCFESIFSSNLDIKIRSESILSVHSCRLSSAGNQTPPLQKQVIHSSLPLCIINKHHPSESSIFISFLSALCFFFSRYLCEEFTVVS